MLYKERESWKRYSSAMFIDLVLPVTMIIGKFFYPQIPELTNIVETLTMRDDPEMDMVFTTRMMNINYNVLHYINAHY